MCRILNRVFGFDKVRYRGVANNYKRIGKLSKGGAPSHP